MEIVAQPGHFAWSIYDERCHEIMKEFDDYHDALKAGCIREAGTLDDLVTITKLPAALKDTVVQVAAMTRGEKEDSFGRDFTGHPELKAPYYAVKVSAALFHTQGGLIVGPERPGEAQGRVVVAQPVRWWRRGARHFRAGRGWVYGRERASHCNRFWPPGRACSGEAGALRSHSAGLVQGESAYVFGFGISRRLEAVDRLHDRSLADRVSPASFFIPMGVFVIPLTEEFGWSRGATQFAFSFVMISAALTGPIVGSLTDQIRRPRDCSHRCPRADPHLCRVVIHLG